MKTKIWHQKCAFTKLLNGFMFSSLIYAVSPVSQGFFDHVSLDPMLASGARLGMTET